MIADILLVDDNCIQATTRKAILARSGSVAVACDGTQALAMLEQAGGIRPVGLVVTDHLMPGMNGRSLLPISG